MMLELAVLRIRIRDPVLFWHLDPDPVKVFPDSGSRISNPYFWEFVNCIKFIFVRFLPVFGAGTKFLIEKFLITKFLTHKVPNNKIPNHKIPK